MSERAPVTEKHVTTVSNNYSLSCFQSLLYHLFSEIHTSQITRHNYRTYDLASAINVQAASTFILYTCRLVVASLRSASVISNHTILCIFLLAAIVPALTITRTATAWQSFICTAHSMCVCVCVCVSVSVSVYLCVSLFACVFVFLISNHSIFVN